MTHTEVSRVLWRLGILHHNEFMTPDGHFCIDVALEGTNVSGCHSSGSGSLQDSAILSECEGVTC